VDDGNEFDDSLWRVTVAFYTICLLALLLSAVGGAALWSALTR
jgi:hypothetical protein